MSRRCKAVVPAGERGGIVPLLDDLLESSATSPRLSGGDVDADWQRAFDSGEEAVGGSAPTPDQDVVDELGRAPRGSRPWRSRRERFP